MKVKGFGAWPSRNVSSGGQNSSFDEYNRSFKGDPYNLAYKKKNYGDSTGYMDRGVDEYHRVSEMKDMTADQDDQNAESAVAGGAMRMFAAGAKSSGAAGGGRSRQVVLHQVVGLLVGAIVITAGYQASLRERTQPPTEPGNDSIVEVEPTQDPSGDSSDPAQGSGNHPSEDPSQPTENPSQPTEDPSHPTENSTQPTERSTQPTESRAQPATTSPTQGGSVSPGPSPGTTVSWIWSADNKSATLVVTDSSGNTVREISAAVTASTTPATCNKAGRITYTASATVNGQAYKDVRYKDLPALGHSFDSGKEVTLADGRTAMDYECTRCHEHFTIVNSIDEE